LEDKHWSGISKGHTGGEGPEALGGEMFSMRQETVAIHGKKLRPWLHKDRVSWKVLTEVLSS
jgi:hypothetical protein